MAENRRSAVFVCSVSRSVATAIIAILIALLLPMAL